MMKLVKKIITIAAAIIMMSLLFACSEKQEVLESADAVDAAEVIDTQHISLEDLLKELNMAGLKKGDAAPDFSVKTNKGTDFTLSEQKGKKVVVAFFATW